MSFFPKYTLLSLIKTLLFPGIFCFHIFCILFRLICCLKEESVGSVGLEQRSRRLLDSGWEWEFDLVVVHLLDDRSLGVLDGDGVHAKDL